MDLEKDVDGFRLLLSDSPWNMQIFCRHAYVSNTDQIFVIIEKHPSSELNLPKRDRGAGHIWQSLVEGTVLQLNWHEHIICVKHATRRIFGCWTRFDLAADGRLRRSSFDAPWQILLRLPLYTKQRTRLGIVVHCLSVVSSRTGLFITIHRGVS